MTGGALLLPRGPKPRHPGVRGAAMSLRLLKTGQNDVWAIDARHQNLRLWDTQRVKDAPLGLHSGCRRTGNHRRIAQSSPDIGYAPVIGPEVASPAVHDVCLIDHKEGRSMLCKPSDLLGFYPIAKALRCHIEERPSTGLQELVAHLLLAGSYVGVDECSRQLATVQTIDLVRHQRLQWREDERGRLTFENRRQLEAETLAASCWTDQQLRLATQRTEHCIHLTVAKTTHSEETQARVQSASLLGKLAPAIQEAGERQGPSLDCASGQRDLKVQMPAGVTSIA